MKSGRHLGFRRGMGGRNGYWSLASVDSASLAPMAATPELSSHQQGASKRGLIYYKIPPLSRGPLYTTVLGQIKKKAEEALAINMKGGDV